MRNMRCAGGWMAAGILVLSAGVCSAQSSSSSASGAPDWDAVARSMAGEWEGQIEVRAADGSLSTSLASMSARFSESASIAEFYYEGFAFGKPVDGAIVFAFSDASARALIADQAVRLHASCVAQSPDDSGGSSPSDCYEFLGSSKGHHDDVRARMSRGSGGAWTIEYQSKDKGGDWASLLTMRLHPLREGERSAAAANFDDSPLLQDLRTNQATASVDTDK
ncbi:MAG: hypothetical protein IPJ41_18050 [Phycisphaerales bacterium]|nr:hypothetical protein [Phycisphaerales bacterium]